MPNLPRERLRQTGREQNGAPEQRLIDADYLESLALGLECAGGDLDDDASAYVAVVECDEIADALRRTIKVIQNLEETIASVRRVNETLAKTQFSRPWTT